MQHQQIAGEAAQVFHALGETFSTNVNVRRVASSTDSIASGQVGVAGIKPTNIQTAPSTQLQRNPVREPKVEKKGGRTPVGKGRLAALTARCEPPDGSNLWEFRIEQRRIFIHQKSFLGLQWRKYYSLNQTWEGGGKTIRYQETWKLVKIVVFIQKGFLLLFKKRGQRKDIVRESENLSVLGLKRRGNSIQREIGGRIKRKHNRVKHPEQAKWFNPTFILPKPHQKWRKILDASALNQEIQTIHFKMNGTDQVRDLIRKGDWATSLDLKSAFHHLTVYPPHRPYLAFDTMGIFYQYRAMPFGTQHSPIFFAQALAMVLMKRRRESDIRI
ncbi:MAG: hypothetical protein EZS28_001973 [Streblomastix strix]|uniref:Reverse transcriptase domain-containing protein n=1 Tax=Streblomastix strix TaxID=222440 RepID=A0A5J4X6J0_9EUKA|nr:MAG: hypothetical protein EZS28_001973 [Streblomastix strix]